MLDNLRQMLIAAGLDRAADVIVQESRPSVRIWASAVDDEESLPIGSSKVGGSPDLPPGCEWPTHGGYPLAFVAQINLADVAPYDGERVLPETGILTFFYDYDYTFRGREEWNADFSRIIDDPANWRVYWFEGEYAVLRRTPTPTMRESIEQTGPFAPCRVAFEPSVTILDVFVAEERFSFSHDEWENYHGIQRQLQGTEGDSCSRMLGLPDQIQGEREYLRDGEILLLQLGSEQGAGMMWGMGAICIFSLTPMPLPGAISLPFALHLESG